MPPALQEHPDTESPAIDKAVPWNMNIGNVDEALLHIKVTFCMIAPMQFTLERQVMEAFGDQ